MKILFTRPIVLAAGLFLAYSASAQSQHARFYAEGFVGYLQPGKQVLFGHNEAGVLRDIRIDYGRSANFGARLGMVAADGDWGRVRFDAEANHGSVDVSALALNGVGRVVGGDSKTSLTRTMLNAYYDTPLIADLYRLYGGLGIGAANINHQITYFVANPAASNGQAHIALPGTQTVFAWQAVLGGEVPLQNGWSMTADARYLRPDDYQSQRFILNTPGVGGGSNGTLDSVLKTRWSALSYNVGVRYIF